MIKRFHDAKINQDQQVVIWGSGRQRREFLHADDLADACLFLMDHYHDDEHINIGTGKDIEINELANIIKHIVGYKGTIKNDMAMPDGAPQKLLDITKLTSLGWKYRIELEEGLKRTYECYLSTK